MPKLEVLASFLLLSFTVASGQFLLYDGPGRIVFGQRGLQDALNDSTVNLIRVSGRVTLDSGWSKPLPIRDRNLIIEGDPNNSSNVIDFGGLIDVLVIGRGANVSFNKVGLEHAGPQTLPADTRISDPDVTKRVTALGVWPSLILLDGSSVIFNNSRLQYYSQLDWVRCQNFAQKVLFTLQNLGIGTNVRNPDPTTLQLYGNYTANANITDILTNDTVGTVSLTTIDSNMTCVNNPFTAAGKPISSSGGGFKWWYGLLIAIGVVLLLLLGALFFWLYRRRKKRLAQQGGSMTSSKEPPSHQTAGDTRAPSVASIPSSPQSGSGPTHVTADSASALAVVSEMEPAPKLNGFGSLNSAVSGSGSSLAAGAQTPNSNMGSKHSWADVGLLLRERSDFSDLEFGPLIGTGSFGRVYKGRWKGAFVAIKIVDHKEAANKVLALREGTLSHSAQHPNVITTYSVFTQQTPANALWSVEDTLEGVNEDETMAPREGSIDDAARRLSLASEDNFSTVMILEYADRGTLDKAVSTGKFRNASTGRIDLRAIHATLMDIVGGLAYLHSVGVLHGDLKGANVLLKSTTADARRFTAKLADFGMARLLAENSTHVSTKTYGTISYMPIEVLKHGKLTTSVDSYSFAIIMWELFSGEVLYADMTVAQLYYKVCCEHEKPPIPASMPIEYSQLMQQCWDDDPEQRPTSEEILQYLMAISPKRSSSKSGQIPSGALSNPDHRLLQAIRASPTNTGFSLRDMGSGPAAVRSRAATASSSSLGKSLSRSQDATSSLLENSRRTSTLTSARESGLTTSASDSFTARSGVEPRSWSKSEPFAAIPAAIPEERPATTITPIVVPPAAHMAGESPSGIEMQPADQLSRPVLNKPSPSPFQAKSAGDGNTLEIPSSMSNRPVQNRPSPSPFQASRPAAVEVSHSGPQIEAENRPVQSKPSPSPFQAISVAAGGNESKINPAGPDERHPPKDVAPPNPFLQASVSPPGPNKASSHKIAPSPFQVAGSSPPQR